MKRMAGITGLLVVLQAVTLGGCATSDGGLVPPEDRNVLTSEYLRDYAERSRRQRQLDRIEDRLDELSDH